MRTRILSIGASAATLVLLAGCSSSGSVPSASPSSASATMSAAAASAAPSGSASREAAYSLGLQTVSDPEFRTKVLLSPKPTVVLFTAPWCGPCQRQVAVVEAVKDSYAEDINFLAMDIDANQDTPGRYQVNGVPTLVYFSGGQATAKRTGLTTQTGLREWLDRVS